MLEEGGSNVNVQDDEGISALHWASSGGHVETVQLLLMAGANPNHLEVDGERLTPLDYAIIGGHQEVAQVLIEQGGLSISSVQELAAVMIQKTVRGYLARKKVSPQLMILSEHKISSSKQLAEEEIDGSPSISENQKVTRTDGRRRLGSFSQIIRDGVYSITCIVYYLGS